MQKFINVVFLGLFLSACGGELSYKQGATANDLSKTKKRCQSAGLKTEAEVNQCLEKNGWSVQQLDDLDLFAVASVNPNNQNPQATEHKVLIDAPETAAATTSATENSSPNTEKSVQEHAKIPTNTLPKTTSPLDIYVVSSWWKMGSNRAALEKNIDECVASLGEAHQPNQKTQQVTRGLVVCMYEKGWKALKVK